MGGGGGGGAPAQRFPVQPSSSQYGLNDSQYKPVWTERLPVRTGRCPARPSASQYGENDSQCLPVWGERLPAPPSPAQFLPVRTERLPVRTASLPVGTASLPVQPSIDTTPPSADRAMPSTAAMAPSCSQLFPVRTKRLPVPPPQPDTNMAAIRARAAREHRQTPTWRRLSREQRESTARPRPLRALPAASPLSQWESGSPEALLAPPAARCPRLQPHRQPMGTRGAWLQPAPRPRFSRGHAPSPKPTNRRAGGVARSPPLLPPGSRPRLFPRRRPMREQRRRGQSAGFNPRLLKAPPRTARAAAPPPRSHLGAARPRCPPGAPPQTKQSSGDPR